MQTEINNIIQQAIKEDWFNEMTTSDLQGTCEAAAMNMLRKRGIFDTSQPLQCLNISDKILEGIYKSQEITE